MILRFLFSVCSKNLRKHFESVDYRLILLLLTFDDSCSYTVSLNKCIYYFEQRWNVISKVSKSSRILFLNDPGFQSMGAKIAAQKICKYPTLIVYIIYYMQNDGKRYIFFST